MGTNGANPRSFDEVRVDVPPVYGYPVPPPPPPPSFPTSTSGEATHNHTGSHGRCEAYRCLLIVAGCFCFIGGILIYVATKKTKFPHFQLDHVSVSVDNHVNSTAVWGIDFSSDKSVGDLDVWVRFMTQDFKAESVGTAGKSTVSVTAMLPRDLDFSGGLTIDQVMFKCNHYHQYILQFACKDVSVGFPPWNETEGAMKGGPRSCPLVSKEDVIK